MNSSRGNPTHLSRPVARKHARGVLHLGHQHLFLLDAGLSNLEAFAANSFFTAGMVLFEIPTGVVADTWGRRTSYLLGTITLASSTFSTTCSGW